MEAGGIEDRHETGQSGASRLFFQPQHVVSRHILTRPDPLLCPRLRWIYPEGIVRRQSEVFHPKQAEVQAARIDVWIAHGRLMPHCSGQQPALGI